MRALYVEELGQTILVVPDCIILGHAPGMAPVYKFSNDNFFYFARAKLG